MADTALSQLRDAIAACRKTCTDPECEPWLRVLTDAEQGLSQAYADTDDQPSDLKGAADRARTVLADRRKAMSDTSKPARAD